MTRKSIALLVVVAVAFVSGLALGLGSGLEAQSNRRYINPQVAGDPAVTPFSGAVMAGETLYLSGTLGLGPNRSVPDTPEEEATNVLNSIQAQLKDAGMTMDDLVSLQIFSTNAENYAEFNSVYRGYFTKEFPARAYIGAGTLLFGARFEVQGIAVKR